MKGQNHIKLYLTNMNIDYTYQLIIHNNTPCWVNTSFVSRTYNDVKFLQFYGLVNGLGSRFQNQNFNLYFIHHSHYSNYTNMINMLYTDILNSCNKKDVRPNIIFIYINIFSF